MQEKILHRIKMQKFFALCHVPILFLIPSAALLLLLYYVAVVFNMSFSSFLIRLAVSPRHNWALQRKRSTISLALSWPYLSDRVLRLAIASRYGRAALGR